MGHFFLIRIFKTFLVCQDAWNIFEFFHIKNVHILILYEPTKKKIFISFINLQKKLMGVQRNYILLYES